MSRLSENASKRVRRSHRCIFHRRRITQPTQRGIESTMRVRVLYYWITYPLIRTGKLRGHVDAVFSAMLEAAA